MKNLKLPTGLRLAKIVAEKSTVPTFKVGAALFYNGLWIAACNSPKGSLGAAKYYPYPNEGTHAEYRLFSRSMLDKIPIKGTVFVARMLADNTTGLARSCRFCRDMLRSFGITKIIYTDYGNTYKEEKL